MFSLYSPDNKTNCSLDEVATYIKLALDKVGSSHTMYWPIVAVQQDPVSWQVTNVAALYWRAVGKPGYAVDCLRIAMQYAPDNSKVFVHLFVCLSDCLLICVSE